MADEPKPEERARIKIDEQLADAGWHIADRGGVTYEHNAIALVEGLLEGNKGANFCSPTWTPSRSRSWRGPLRASASHGPSTPANAPSPSFPKSASR